MTSTSQKSDRAKGSSHTASASSAGDNLLLSLMNQHTNGVACLDERGIFRTCNKAFADLLGYPDAKDLTGIPLEKITHADDWQKEKKQFNELTSGKASSYSFEKRFVCKDDSVAWCEETVIRLVKPLNDFDRMLIVHNINKQKAFEQILKDKAEMAQTIINNIGEGINIIDPDGTVLWNNSAHKDVNMSHVGKKCWATLEHRKERCPHCVHHLVMQDGKPRDYETVVEQPDGSKHSWYVRAAPLYDTDGRIYAILEAFLETTERKKEEEERRAFESRMQQIQKDESLALLAGSVAHDFNNMLSAIYGYADILAGEIDEKHGDSSLAGEIVKITQQAKELCAELMAYSGSAQMVFSPVNLNAVIRDIAALLKISISKSALLKLVLQDLLPPIMGDGSQIRQILMNLVINASDALKNKPGTIRVTTSFSRIIQSPRGGQQPSAPKTSESGYVVLEVKDTGCGMTEEVKTKIFEPFFSTKSRGHGLGMAAVAGIVRSHNATIIIDTVLHKGTIIRVYFPVANLP